MRFTENETSGCVSHSLSPAKGCPLPPAHIFGSLSTTIITISFVLTALGLIWSRSWVCSEFVRLQWTPFVPQLGCRNCWLMNSLKCQQDREHGPGCPPWEPLRAAHIRGNPAMIWPPRLWQKACWPSNSRNPWGSADSRSTWTWKTWRRLCQWCPLSTLRSENSSRGSGLTVPGWDRWHPGQNATTSEIKGWCNGLLPFPVVLWIPPEPRAEAAWIKLSHNRGSRGIMF